MCEWGKLQTICLFRKPELNQNQDQPNKLWCRRGGRKRTLIKAYNVNELSRTHEYLRLLQGPRAVPEARLDAPVVPAQQVSHSLLIQNAVFQSGFTNFGYLR